MFLTKRFFQAAHCVKKIPPSWNLVSVIIGEWDTDTAIDCDPDDEKACAPPVIRNRIIEMIVHENYKPKSRDQHYDIAMLRLEDKIEFNDFVEPICMPIDFAQWTQVFTGQTFTVAGLYAKHFRTHFI